jgi:hydroxymethylglutaryl-CoA lyase
MIRLVECPRDAMQGIKTFIPTAEKIAYMQQLLCCNFDYLDCGSFVSPKAVPQMADSAEVLKALDTTVSNTKLLVIIANQRGATEALTHKAIDVLGFPFSLSEIFQMRNTHKSRKQAFDEIKAIQEKCIQASKELVVYLSMAFGNPYGEPWSTELVCYWVDQLHRIGIKTLSLSDTTANADAFRISEVFHAVSEWSFKGVYFGAHFHARTDQWRPNIEAAYLAGCRRFDSAMQGFGGCPMASDRLVGNIPTEKLVSFLTEHKEPLKIHLGSFEVAYNHAKRLFSAYT